MDTSQCLTFPKCHFLNVVHSQPFSTLEGLPNCSSTSLEHQKMQLNRTLLLLIYSVIHFILSTFSIDYAPFNRMHGMFNIFMHIQLFSTFDVLFNNIQIPLNLVHNHSSSFIQVSDLLRFLQQCVWGGMFRVRGGTRLKLNLLLFQQFSLFIHHFYIKP